MNRLSIVFATTMILLAILVAFLVTAGPAAAESELGPDDHCSLGDAVSIMNAFFPLFQHGDNSPNDIARRCQFRTFREPEEGICFCEHDEFVGATAWFELRDDPDYEEWSAHESVSLVEIILSITEPAGQPIDPFVTAVKGGLHPVFGSIFWKQVGAIFNDLVPGDYTVLTEFDHPAEAIYGEFDPAVVNFKVLPHDEAHALGRPASGLAGSVICPQDTN